MNAPLRPGYKQTEVGVIPEDWRTPPLGSLTVLMTNGFVGTATRHYAANENGIRYIQGYNVEENSFNFHGIKFVTEDFHRSHLKSCLRGGDLLTVQTGDVGLTTVVPVILAGSNCHALIISRFDQKRVFPAFISYYLNSKPGRSRLKLIETGTTMKHLNVGDVLQFVVPLPPTKAEQEAIAEALSDADALIESLEQLLAKKRHLKQGTMQQLLTGKKRLPGFSGEWEVKRLGELFDVFAGGDFDPSRSNDVRDERHPFPVYSNAVTDTGLYSFCTYSVYPARTITVTARGTLGVANYRDHPYTAIGRVLVLQPKLDLDGRFFAEFINNRINFVVESTGVPQLTAPQISKYELPVPLYAEQTAIATVLSDMDAELAALEQKLTKARHLKQGMMQELLTGRIRLV